MPSTTIILILIRIIYQIKRSDRSFSSEVDANGVIQILHADFIRMSKHGVIQDVGVISTHRLEIQFFESMVLTARKRNRTCLGEFLTTPENRKAASQTWNRSV
jgi:hypothetical protein